MHDYKLFDYETGEFIRLASTKEVIACWRASFMDDNGQGVIMVDGRKCYVA